MTTPRDCSDLNVISPDDVLRDDCPVLGKERYVVVDKGVCATIRWPMRDRAGTAVDLSSCVDCPAPSGSSSSSSCVPGQIIARFNDAFGGTSTIHQIIGEIHDAETGVVDIPLSELLVADSSIFKMQIGVTDPDGALIFVDTGLLSVERGLFGSLTSLTGPPTIQEVRLQLRDTLYENHLLDRAEFDDVEILHSIIRPFREFVEKPPNLGELSPQEFPWHDHWLNAVVANLLFIAAHWYERNRLPAQHGGISVDDAAKANPYLAVATRMRDEWINFIMTKKVELNAQLAYGTFGSHYGWRYIR